MRGIGGQFGRLGGAALVAVLALGGLPPAGVRAASPITVDFAVASRPYDGTLKATVTGCSLTGVTPPDEVICDWLGATANFLDPDAGVAKTVSGSGFALAGAQAANYEIGPVNTSSADITPASQTITFAPAPTGIVVGGTGFSVGATASSGLAVASRSPSLPSCSVDAQTAPSRFSPPAPAPSHANQAGNANWNAAPQVAQSFDGRRRGYPCHPRSDCRPSP